MARSDSRRTIQLMLTNWKFCFVAVVKFLVQYCVLFARFLVYGLQNKISFCNSLFWLYIVGVVTSLVVPDAKKKSGRGKRRKKCDYGRKRREKKRKSSRRCERRKKKYNRTKNCKSLCDKSTLREIFSPRNGFIIRSLTGF